MANKKQPSFTDLTTEGPVVTDTLAKKVDKMYKVFASKSFKKLLKNSEADTADKELKSVDPKSTKIDKLDSEDGTMAILNKILTFMQKTHDEDKLALEEQKNFAEEQALEKAKRQRDMLDTLIDKKKKGDMAPKTEKEEEKSLLDSFGSLGSTLLSVASFFLGNPWLLPLVGGAAILAAMAFSSKESHEEASNVQKAGDVSTEGAAIMNIDSIDKRKAKILREAHKSGKIKAGMFDFAGQDKEEKAYLKEIGFDPKTGLTDADRTKGYNFVDDDGNPMFSEYQDKQNKAKSIPTPMAAPTAPSANPAPPANANSKLTAATNENIDSKLKESVNAAQEALQSSSTNIMNMSKDRTPKEIQPVRNQEATFQRMIFNNTRIV